MQGDGYMEYLRKRVDTLSDLELYCYVIDDEIHVKQELSYVVCTRPYQSMTVHWKQSPNELTPHLFSHLGRAAIWIGYEQV
jgi:hypothetical protein